MAITRAQMRRQLYRGGGIASVPRRQRYGLGSKWQDFKDKAVDKFQKIVPNEIAEVATKAAPFVAPFNPLAAGLMRGLGRLDQRGDLGDALKQGLLTYGGGKAIGYLGGAEGVGSLTGPQTYSMAGFKGGPIGSTFSNLAGAKDVATTSGVTGKSVHGAKDATLWDKAKGAWEAIPGGRLGKMAAVGAAGTGVALLADKLVGPKKPDETMEQYMTRRKSTVGKYLKFYYKRTNPLASEQEVANFVSQNTGEYANGGRIGYVNGGVSSIFGNPDRSEYEEFMKNIYKNVQGFENDLEKRLMNEYDLDRNTARGYASTINFYVNSNPLMLSGKEKKLEEGYLGKNEIILKELENEDNRKAFSGFAKGGRVKYNMGVGPAGLPGIPRMAPDGIEYDMRASGGFQPLGAQEGKDDVNAKLAKNEFVFTADAVRAAGGGSIQKGAQRMYDTMKRLESRVA